jgi:hypothetical protein
MRTSPASGLPRAAKQHRRNRTRCTVSRGPVLSKLPAPCAAQAMRHRFAGIEAAGRRKPSTCAIAGVARTVMSGQVPKTIAFATGNKKKLEEVR